MARVAWSDIGKVMVGVVLTAALVPVTASASGQLVTLVDSDTNAKAQVENGRLRVGDGDGPLTVNGTLTDSRRGQTPWHREVLAEVGASGYFESAVFTVPEGKRLVLTHFSALVELPSAGSVESLRVRILDFKASGAVPAFPTTFGYDSTTTSGTRRYLSYDADVEIMVDAGDQVRMHGYMTEDGDKLEQAVFHGYLVNT